MYNVFLVDDEPILLEGIRSKIDWESIGLNFVGEFVVNLVLSPAIVRIIDAVKKKLHF